MHLSYLLTFPFHLYTCSTLMSALTQDSTLALANSAQHLVLLINFVHLALGYSDLYAQQDTQSRWTVMHLFICVVFSLYVEFYRACANKYIALHFDPVSCLWVCLKAVVKIKYGGAGSNQRRYYYL